MPSAQTHAESGADFPSPDDFEGPEEFATALFDRNQADGSINKEKFIGLAHCCFQAAQEDIAPEQMVLQFLQQACGPMGESEKCETAAREIVAKIAAEVIPFVASEVFDVMDRDKSQGISKEEIDLAITAAMEGPSAAFGMIFKAIDKDGSGSLSAAELSQFFANIVKMAGKCALVFINVFAATFKDDMADMVTEGAFGQLDQNQDGFVDKEELADMVEGLATVKAEFGGMKEKMAEMGQGPEVKMFELVTGIIATCKAAGDLNPQAFYELFETIMNAQIDQFRAMIANTDELPIPPQLVEKITPFAETAISALQAAVKVNMKAVTDAWFNILDANSDGIVQNSELMAVFGVPDSEITAEQSFDALFAMVDSAGEGKISKAEGTAFAMKIFDLVTVAAKNGVEVYMAVINAVAAEVFKFFIEQLAGGDDLTAEAFEQLSMSVAQDGPEALMGIMME